MRRPILLAAILVLVAGVAAGYALWRDPEPETAAAVGVALRHEAEPGTAAGATSASEAPGREEAPRLPGAAQLQQGGAPVERPPDEPASAGPVLSELERRLRGSPEVRACLAGAPRTGTLEYELTSDTSGITFLRGGDLLDTPVRPCVEDELSTIIESLASSPSTERNVHKVTLQARR
jgi:hypothetical protein